MDWDKTPVSAYLPEFQLKDPYLNSQVTLADILSHRSVSLFKFFFFFFVSLYFCHQRRTDGIGRSPENSCINPLIVCVDPLPSGSSTGCKCSILETAHSRRELIKRLRHVDVKYPLRTEYHYNNVCYIVAGMPYEDVVRVKVINPMGLTNTGFSYQEMQTRPNYTMPYHAKTMEDAQQGKFIAGELELSYQNGSAAGFIYSNVLDLATWAKTMMHKGELDGKQILNKESIKTIQTAHSIVPGNRGLDFGIVSAYGFGWVLTTTRDTPFIATVSISLCFYYAAWHQHHAQHLFFAL